MNSSFINFPQAVFKSRIKWKKKIHCNIRVLACWVCDAFWSQSRWSSDWSVGGAVTCVLPRHPHCLTWLAIRIEYSRNDSRLCHVSQIKWQKKKKQVVKVFIWCLKRKTTLENRTQAHKKVLTTHFLARLLFFLPSPEPPRCPSCVRRGRSHQAGWRAPLWSEDPGTKTPAAAPREPQTPAVTRRQQRRHTTPPWHRKSVCLSTPFGQQSLLQNEIK